MTSSPEQTLKRDDLPPALSSMWRVCKLGYHHEPTLILAAFTLAVLSALPDALLAYWFMLIGEGSDRRQLAPRAIRSRGDRRVRHRDVVPADRQHSCAAPLPRQGHHRARVTRRAAAGLDHHHRAPGTSRVSRSPLGAAQSGLHAGPHVHVALLDLRVDPASGGDDRAADVHPPGAVAAGDLRDADVLTSSWRPAVERTAYERGASSSRLARHLFDMATTATPGKEVRVTGIGDRLAVNRRQAFETGNRPDPGHAMDVSGWHTLAWAIFGTAYVGAIVFVSSTLRAPAADVLLVAGRRIATLLLRRRHRRRDRVPAVLDGFRQAPRLARGLCGVDRRGRRSTVRRIVWRKASGSSTSRSPIQGPIDSFSTTSISRCPPAGSWRLSARTGRARRPWSSCSPRCTTPTRGRILIDGNDSGAHPRRGLACPHGRCVPGLLPVRVPGASDDRHRRPPAHRRRASRHDAP